MDDVTFQKSKIDKPFKFFGREFTSQDIGKMEFKECEDWIILSKQTITENDEYITYRREMGTPLEGFDLAKKIGFKSAMKKFIFLLENRKRDIGDSFDKVFYDVCKDNLADELFEELVDLTNNRLDKIEDDKQIDMFGGD